MPEQQPVYILGVNFAYHELSACIIRDGRLIAAIEEERFSRKKRGKKALVSNPDTLPLQAIQFCLNRAGIRLEQVDHIGLSFYPQSRLRNIHIDSYFTPGDWGSKEGEELFNKKILQIPSRINELTNTDLTKRMHWIPHHRCHAASTFFVSPFADAAVLSIDGIGEFSSTWMGHGQNNKIRPIKEVFYPNSVGFLWEKMSKYLGFSEYDSSKIMGLSAYGNPERFFGAFQDIVALNAPGEFLIRNDIMRFRQENYQELEKLFGVKRITSPTEIAQDQKDLAAALQKITDAVIVHLARYLKEKTRSESICLAGGVALNCVSNAAILESGLFSNLYVQPAANDAGTALGAAYHIWNELLEKPRGFVMDTAYWGPEYSDQEILEAIKLAGVKQWHQTKHIAAETAKLLSEGNIIGWFQGRVEWGPRALGNRTLLADPRRPDMKQILNERIKKREPFRPFAPSVLQEHFTDWFEVPKKSHSISEEFMVLNFRVQQDKQKLIPAVTHADGTSRVQVVRSTSNPRYHELIFEFFKLTNVPLVLNTSFNDNEPIVCSPSDAIKTFLRTKMDHLAIGDYLLSKA